MKQIFVVLHFRIALRSLIAGSALGAVVMAGGLAASHGPPLGRLSNTATLASHSAVEDVRLQAPQQAFGTASAYIPPKDSEQPSGSASTTGIRSCGIGDSELTLLALAPREHIGKTALSHPTFVWYVPESKEFDTTFKLYRTEDEVESGNVQRTFTKVLETSLTSNSGFMTFTLPLEEEGLTPGGHYLWQVSMQCDADDRAALVVAEADLLVDSELEGVSLNSQMEVPLEAIDRYAGWGLWYDALGLASLDTEDDSLQMARASLLEQLSAIELFPDPSSEELYRESAAEFSHQLRLVANRQKLVADLEN